MINGGCIIIYILRQHRGAEGSDIMGSRYENVNKK